MNVTIICSICGSSFECPPNTAPRRDVCNRSRCRQVYTKRINTDRHVEIMSDVEIRQFLSAAKGFGEVPYTAFRLAINAMLSHRELLRIKASDIPQDDCRLKVPSSSRNIELDCQTVELTRKICPDHGRVFPYSGWKLRWLFKKALKSGNVYDYTLPALRHTGIRIRAQQIRNLADMERLRIDAGLRSMWQLKPYLDHTDYERTSFLAKVKWAR